MTPILTSSPLTTTLTPVNLAIIVFIIVLLCGVAGFTMWAVQLRKPRDGFIDSGPITITPPASAPYGTIITVVCRRCGRVLRPNPGETVIHHACQGRKDRYEVHRGES